MSYLHFPPKARETLPAAGRGTPAGFWSDIAHCLRVTLRTGVVLLAVFVVTLSAASASQFTLSWTDNSTNEDGFKVERSLDGSTFAQIATVSANITSYVDSGLLPSTNYWYRVRAYNSAGDSGYSNVASGTTPAANTAPTISNIGNVTIAEDANTGALGFTVGDAETAAASLTVSGSSSNTTLVPNANIVLGGSGANRTVTVTPAANQNGTVTITITVSDGTLSATDTFVVTVTAVNDPPTITSIANQTISAGGNTGALAFTVGDAETSATSLSVTRNSSNTTLIPLANVVLGGSGANRTVTITPAASQTGTSTITVTVNDGSLSTATTFVVTVTPVGNTAPTITSVANQTISAGGNTGALAFTVGDVETAAASLTVSGSSSNTTLVPNANIVLGGSGASRTVTVTPASGQTGAATITLSVSDGTLSTTSSFTLTVNAAANTAPTISNIGNVTIAEDANTGALGFTVGDVETAAASLTVSGSSSNTALVPNANIVLGGSGASRTVTVTPAANQNGTATITITVSDGTLSATDTFVVTVTAVNDPPTITSVANQTISAGGNTGALAFTVGDVETAAASLTVSGSSSNTNLAPNTNIVLSGSGASRTVTVTPASGQTGAATITLSVSDGALSTTSSFTLTVIAANTAPTISTQPAPVSVVAGGLATFSVIASGNPAPTYQWRFKGATIAGATSSVLTLNNVQSGDAGNYSVLVSNSQGSITSANAALSVVPAISISAQPLDQTVARKAKVSLSVTATGTGLSYQWYSGASGDTSAPIPGAVTASFTTTTLTQTATYWVRVSGASQVVDSRSATVTVVNKVRAFFGSFAADSSAGFAMLLRVDDTAGMLASTPGNHGGVAIDGISVSENGALSASGTALGNVIGQLGSGVVSGSVAAPATGFSGVEDSFDGATAAYAGMYDGVILNSADGLVTVIAGGDGHAFVQVSSGGVVSGIAAALSSAGSMGTTLGDGRALTLSIDSATGTLTGVIADAGLTKTVSGIRENVATTRYLANTSVRAQVRSDAGVMIAGFVISGSGTKKVLLRGVGPTLSSFGVSGVLADPIMTLYSAGAAAPISQNDNWGTSANGTQIAAAAAKVGAFALSTSSKDAAILIDLPAGAYTAQVSGVGGGTGAAIVEVYDVDDPAISPSTANLANISMRGVAGNGADTVIGGFVVSGTAPKRVLIRAVGPELAGFGVPGALSDPTLSILQSQNGQSTAVASNDDWGAAGNAVSTVGNQVGAFPLTGGSKSAALVLWLEPGVYTAQASGVGGASGVCIVEMYEVP